MKISNHFQLKYGLSVSGKLSASIDGVSFNTSVTVDYSKKPCQVDLQHLRITKFGKMDVVITGLGPLNHFTSHIINWVTKKWNKEIAEKVEEEVKDIVQSHINEFNCEKYRP